LGNETELAGLFHQGRSCHDRLSPVKVFHNANLAAY